MSELKISNGEIKNVIKFKQALLFINLRDNKNDKRTGTDIDFEYEDGKIWLKVEVKEYGKPMTTGQRILFERFCNNIQNYEAYGILVWHNSSDDEDIYLKDCIVSKIYHKGKWKDVIALRGEKTFKEVFNKLCK
jgi:hypothetical protein